MELRNKFLEAKPQIKHNSRREKGLFALTRPPVPLGGFFG